jgi:TRAP-type C4-dicarboxylate transport system permease small subunit
MRRFMPFLLALLICVVTLAVPALAAPGAQLPSDEELAMCLAWSVPLGIAISFLKRLPFGLGRLIASNPRTCQIVLSAVVALAPLLKGSGPTIAQIAICAGAYFAGSLATYKIGITPVSNFLGIAPPETA